MNIIDIKQHPIAANKSGNKFCELDGQLAAIQTDNYDLQLEVNKLRAYAAQMEQNRLDLMERHHDQRQSAAGAAAKVEALSRIIVDALKDVHVAGVGKVDANNFDECLLRLERMHADGQNSPIVAKLANMIGLADK